MACFSNSSSQLLNGLIRQRRRRWRRRQRQTRRRLNKTGWLTMNIYTNCNILYILVMPHFWVVNQRISHQSLVFSWYIPGKYKRRMGSSTIHHEKGLYNYFIACHRKYSHEQGQHNQGSNNSWKKPGGTSTNNGKLGSELKRTDQWEGSVEYGRIYNGFPAISLAAFSMVWYKKYMKPQYVQESKY